MKTAVRVVRHKNIVMGPARPRTKTNCGAKDNSNLKTKSELVVSWELALVVEVSYKHTSRSIYVGQSQYQAMTREDITHSGNFMHAGLNSEVCTLVRVLYTL
jgi:hypothetical protein